MRKIFLLLLLVCLPALANVYSVRVDTSVNNLPDAPADSSASRVIQGVRNMKGVLAFFTGVGVVALNCSSTPSVVPAATGHTIYIPGGGKGSIAIDSVGLSGTCYAWGDSGTISSGILYLMVNGD